MMLKLALLLGVILVLVKASLTTENDKLAEAFSDTENAIANVVSDLRGKIEQELSDKDNEIAAVRYLNKEKDAKIEELGADLERAYNTNADLRKQINTLRKQLEEAQ